MLTSELDPGLLADDGAVDVPGHADVRPGVLLLPGVCDNQVPPNKAVELVWLLHQLDLPVIPAPPRGDCMTIGCMTFRHFSGVHTTHTSSSTHLYEAGGFARALQFIEILPSGESSV